ncbi:MAG: FAD-binding protein, partial [Vicinamibacterales bacterium]
MIHVDDLRSPGPIIVGSGAAGLTSALRLGDCLVLTKTGLTEGSSRWAQGGIAAAVGPADTPDVHARDTMTVSRGLADPAIVEIVAAAAEARIEWLIEMGAHFDHDATGEIALGREAGHSRNRIIHANGDATGAELMRTLREAVADRSDIEIIERAGVVDLIRADEGIAGVLAEIDGRRIAFIAPVVILATGGIGRVFART